MTEARGELRQRKAARIAKQVREDAVTLDSGQLDHVVQFIEQLKKPLGKRLIAQGLRGSTAKAVKRKGLQKMTTTVCSADTGDSDCSRH